MATVTTMHPEPDPAPPCPWCGPGTQLALRGDGIGGQALWCTGCGCKGPTVAIGESFADADLATLSRWGHRPPAAPQAAADLVGRLSASIRLHAAMAGGIDGTSHVPVVLGDLVALMSAAGTRPSL